MSAEDWPACTPNQEDMTHAPRSVERVSDEAVEAFKRALSARGLNILMDAPIRDGLAAALPHLAVERDARIAQSYAIGFKEARDEIWDEIERTWPEADDLLDKVASLEPRAALDPSP